MDKGISIYFNKQNSPQKQICRKLHRIILKTFPKIKSEMQFGAPWYEKFYIAGLRDSVNLGFFIKGLPQKDMVLLKGSGKMMRHIKIRTLKDIDEIKLVKLIRLVYRKSAKCPHN